VIADKDLGGEKALQTGGLSIRSTLDTNLQLAAARAIRKGLEDYDRRHGWRGPLKLIEVSDDAALAKIAAPPVLTSWTRAVVTDAAARSVKIRTVGGSARELTSEDVQWAAAGARKKKERALTPGAAIYVDCPEEGKCRLKQVPQVEGALVAMDPHTGRVLALIGGYDFRLGEFSRVTDAKRQPGSSFKPIVYSAALDRCAQEGEKGCGLTPATLIEDAPFSVQAGDGTVWAPDNYTQNFLGPVTMRTALAKSLNTVTARLVYEMGPERVLDRATQLGIYDSGRRDLAVFSLGLGVGETKPLRLVTAYATFVNGGRRVKPMFVDRIQDRDGRTVRLTDQRRCERCNAPWDGQAAPLLPDVREQELDPITAFQVVSMAQGVVEEGTATALKSLGKTLGGKTGTTNDYKDAWFVGFSPDLVVGVWVGFDKPKSLGEGESGGRLAVPIAKDFFAVALKGQPDTPFRMPPGVRLVRVDSATGQLPSAETPNTIIEAFRPGTEPTYETAGASPLIIGAGETGVEGGVQIGGPEAMPPPTAPQSRDDLGGLY
jgi:penicillin-binding protein 1A